MSRKRSSQARGHPRSTGGSGSQGSPQTSVYPWEWPIYFGYVLSQLPSRKRDAAFRRIAQARHVARGRPPDESMRLQHDLLFPEGDVRQRSRGRPPKTPWLLWAFWNLRRSGHAKFRILSALARQLGTSPGALRLRLDRAMVQFNVLMNAEHSKLGLDPVPRTQQRDPWSVLVDGLAATPDSHEQIAKLIRKLPARKRKVLLPYWLSRKPGP